MDRAKKSDTACEHGAKEKFGKGMADKLYEIYDELTAAPDKGALEKQYKHLLQAVHSGEKGKGLASQFITRFAEHFPNLEMETANALFDLCEDDDAVIRKQAEKDLVTVCKKLPNLVSTVADVLAQILQTEHASELNIVHNSLVSLLHINPEAAITGILAQIRTGEPIVRDRCFKFLQSKYRNLGAEVMTAKFEKCLFQEAGKAVKAVETRDQFMITMEILNSTKRVTTKEGRKSIVEMIETMLDTKRNFCPSGKDAVAKLLFAVDFAFPYFHEEKGSASLFIYFCTRVLPNIKPMAENNESDYFSILKMTVELFLYVGAMDEKQVKMCLASLLNVAEAFLFEEPENPLDDKIPSYNFSFIESIFYLIYKLTCIQPALLEAVVKPREHLRSKVGYLLRAAVPYKTKIRTELQSMDREDLRNELLKIACLRTLANISVVGKILYNAESTFTGKVRLSWKVTVPSLSACSSPVAPPVRTRRVTLVKRRRITDERSRDYKHLQEKIYQPPNGKYSGRTMSYDDGYSSRGYKRRRTGSGRSASRMERFVVRRSVRY